MQLESGSENQCCLVSAVCHVAQVAADAGEALDMEACFSQLTLDVIGKALFNYDFDALNTSSPLIQVLPAASAHT